MEQASLIMKDFIDVMTNINDDNHHVCVEKCIKMLEHFSETPERRESFLQGSKHFSPIAKSFLNNYNSCGQYDMVRFVMAVIYIIVCKRWIFVYRCNVDESTQESINERCLDLTGKLLTFCMNPIYNEEIASIRKKSTSIRDDMQNYLGDQ